MKTANQKIKEIWEDVKESQDFNLDAFKTAIIFHHGMKYQKETANSLSLNSLSLTDLKVLSDETQLYIEGYQDSEGNIDESNVNYIKDCATLELILEHYDKRIRQIRNLVK